MSTRVSNPFFNTEVVDILSSFHDNYVIVPVDKASNTIVFICYHYLECFVTKELSINSTTGNPTYSLTLFTKEEILENYKNVPLSFGLPSLYWISTLHKTPYKER